MRKPIDWKKYILTFALTCLIFAAVLYVNNILDQKRIGDLKSIQDQISLDLLSSETQFNLLSQTSCKSISDDSILSPELDSLATKLSYMEANDQGAPSPDLLYLKKYYSLLEIKDFLLMQQVGQKCKPSGANLASTSVAILYFYGNRSDCADCENTAYVLTYLRQQYPELRVYSFDYNLQLSAVDTLKSVYGITGANLPAIVIADDTYYGFKSVDQMKALIPLLKQLDKLQNSSTGSMGTSTTKAGLTGSTTSPAR